MSWTEAGVDKLVDHVGRWRAAGASHLSINTMNAGLGPVDRASRGTRSGGRCPRAHWRVAGRVDSWALAPRGGRCEHVFVSSVRDDPARRPRRVLRVRGAARRPPPARAAGDRRRRRGARGQLRGQGVRGAHGDGRAQARRLCPDAVVVRPRFGAYSEASKAVFAVFDETTPLVEGLSIDEAFLDVDGLERISGHAAQIAARLRREVREQVGLPITVGVATTQVPRRRSPAPSPSPTGCSVVPPARARLPAPAAGRAVVGRRARHRPEAARAGDPTVGESPATRGGARVDARRARRAAISTRWPTTATRGGSGSAGGGVDRLPARAGPPPAIARRDRRGRRRAGRPRHAPDASAGRAGRTVVLRLRFADFTRPTRRTRCPRVTSHTPTILATVRALFAHRDAIDREAGPHSGRRLGRQPGQRHAVQLALPFDRRSDDALDAALDGVRDRFGSSAVNRAVLLGRARDSRCRCCPIEERADRRPMSWIRCGP